MRERKTHKQTQKLCTYLHMFFSSSWEIVKSKVRRKKLNRDRDRESVPNDKSIHMNTQKKNSHENNTLVFRIAHNTKHHLQVRKCSEKSFLHILKHNFKSSLGFLKNCKQK